MGKGNEDLFSDLFSKVVQLEKSMKTFQAEMDIKMKIVEQVLTTKNEQFVVLKQLLDEEHSLYDAVLDHWTNTSTLAANGLSINFTSANYEGNIASIQNQKNSTSRISSSAARRDRKRKLFQKMYNQSGEEHTNLDDVTDEVTIVEDTTDTIHPSPNSEGAHEWDTQQFNRDIDKSDEKSKDPDYDPLESDMSKKRRTSPLNQSIQKQGFNQKPNKYRKSKVWNYVTPHGTGKAWCNACQKIISCSNGRLTPGSSISTIRRHLKSKHPNSFEEMCQAEMAEKLAVAQDELKLG